METGVATQERPIDGANVVMVRKGDGATLWNVRAYPPRGVLDLPGGGVDARDIDFVATACREFVEETGIVLNPTELTFLGRYVYDHTIWSYWVLVDAFPKVTLSHESLSSRVLSLIALLDGLERILYPHRAIALDALRVLGFAVPETQYSTGWSRH
jgi:8-oxo-dGTP pyrophosphatase MutT (NUDIX family)